MPKALLVFPENPITFWSFDEALKMVGKKSAFPPLGLLTIAGMMPEDYDLRLVDMNVKPLRDEDLDWADIVLTSTMIIHWHSLERVIARCNARGIPVLNGGPLPTQYYEEIEGDAVFFLGEAETGFLDILENLVKNGASSKREYIDRRGQFLELSKSPLPRWDLIDFKDYSSMVVQMTRGCPESCTFCNIPSLYGKITRIKSKSRMVQELDALYDAGWIGSIMAVDDNFVGNKDEIRIGLEEEVVPWQQARGYPFQFHTQASIRVSDDPALLEAMYQAGFDKVFAGIESPVEESLKFMGAQKNLQGNTSLLDKVKILQEYGFEVQAGFIIGLDTDPDDIAERMISFIQEAGIPIAMVGILGVLRDTPDHKRFSRAGRLVEDVKYTGDSGIFSRELSFVPSIEPKELFDRHRRVVETLNSPEIFFKRCLTHFKHQGRRPIGKTAIRLPETLAFFRSLWRQGFAGNYKWDYWKYFYKALRYHPRSFANAVRLAVQGHHLIVSTQQALHVDEMKTFFPEALEYLERHCKGYREALQRNVGAYASRLMQVFQSGFEHLEHIDLHQAARQLQTIAQEHHSLLREEFRNQVREPLEKFQREIEEILETYARDGRGLSRELR